ncbi:apolipoprotein N-acyltransferase [Shewanella sp. WXL01]|uniref:apolipoprotein N-acyltransferase n=1 Tax=Shewanella sp. WXL01 TaxID=2709721 RepID=UPI0014385DB5|nr:apolipoprotein N-acyltransferase [Shewanella sp. WXL01]
MLSQALAKLNQGRISLVTAFAAGASTALAFAPYNIWAIYPLALAFALFQSQSKTPKQSLFYWLSFGFGCFAVGISWVHVSIDTFGGMPLVVSMALMGLLALYLAIYPALCGYLLAKLQVSGRFASYWQYLGLFPALWVLTEWLRGWVLTGFPWLWAGYSQTLGPLSQLASIIGALGLSFIIALAAGSLALLAQKRWLPLLVVAPLIISLAYLAPKFNPITENGDSVKVALVQGNIPQSMKWEPENLWPTMVKYMDLTRNHFDDESSLDIVVWPEAAIPAPEVLVSDFLVGTNDVARFNNIAIITGIISKKPSGYYNALVVLGNHFNKQQNQGDYEINGSNEFLKHHLLPIGEFVPFESLLRPLAPFFNLPMSSFMRGDYQQPNLNALGYQVAPAICYEIVFPEQVRANTNIDTDLLLTVSNDAWFGTSNGPLQHMEIAQMRAIELGKPLLRATNNGVTAVVDPYGKITEQLPQFETGVLVTEVPLYQGETLFMRFGQLPLLLFSTLLLLLSLAFKYRTKYEK